MAHETIPGLWGQLNTTTLGGPTAATASEIVNQTDPIHIEAGNLSAIQSANIINEGAMRNGSAIPNTGVVYNANLTDNSRTVLFAPSAGEVVIPIAATAYADTTPSGAIVYQLFYQVNDSGGTARLITVGKVSSATQTTDLSGLFDNNPPQYVDENVSVQCIVDTMSGTSEIDFSVFTMRVR